MTIHEVDIREQKQTLVDSLSVKHKHIYQDSFGLPKAKRFRIIKSTSLCPMARMQRFAGLLEPKSFKGLEYSSY